MIITLDLKTIALDIEQERILFEAAYREKYLESCLLNPFKFDRSGENEYMEFKIEIALQMWLAAKRFMPQTEKVMNANNWEEFYSLRETVKNMEDKVIQPVLFQMRHRVGGQWKNIHLEHENFDDFVKQTPDYEFRKLCVML